MDFFTAIRDFLEAGGGVLWVILFAAILMWGLILERLTYFRTDFPRMTREVIEQWRKRPEFDSWQSRQIRRAKVSQVSREANRNIAAIKTIVALCPLLGLLGTVTGMIQVFDVMAALGTGNARAMASGIFKATIPTMAGMVVALSGIYFGTHFPHVVRRETDYLNDELGVHESN
ncbi:putative TonB system-dependent transport protein [Oceanococcus atlanticus]|uniref:Putative TonB system-dependent transport protein n=1 Tax=Oceanococcus atlanticus TaxID=1317117 RepID=A0A1Y1SIK2_9GAMM|nr:MotA/TolQ/ExbB proton channel family protein [Oceanococcus atlanticus]ORE89484.1 putative TonB system-dependent transport protein [Oceanococcus atlanticus]RZO83632.1 MAG: MotA/TolQ/ExbB proton channel family protein [Oceanococcus sp.]